MKNNNKKIKNVFLGHSLEEYKSIYDIDKTIHIDKYAVDQFNKSHRKDSKDSPLEGRLWWLIDDVYYEVESINPKVNKNKKSKGHSLKIALAGILGGVGGLGILGGGGYLAYRVMQSSDPEPVVDNLTFEGNAVSAKNTDISGKITIPSKNPNTGDFITTIKTSGFSGCKKITEVVLPDTITTINQYSFRFCESLTKINIPNALIRIEDSAFEGCISLEAISLHENISYVGDRAFADCGALSDVIIDSQNALIDNISEQKSPCLFHHAKKVYVKDNLDLRDATELTRNYTQSTSDMNGYILFTPNTEMRFKATFDTSWATDCYYRYSGTAKTVNINVNNCKSLLSFAFANNNTIESVTFPTSLLDTGTNYSGRAFYNCVNLKSVKLNDGLNYIEDETFLNCSSLDTIDIPNSLLGIGNYAFKNCSSLESITIPEMQVGLTIGGNAFEGCNSLNLVTIKDPLFAKIKNNDSQLFTNAGTVKIIDTINQPTEGDYIFDNYPNKVQESGYWVYQK